jgi:tRNA pseudouridine55 synthase
LLGALPGALVGLAVPNVIVLLDKPVGLSSNAALQRVRRALRAESAGHIGTLDPLASGMLPICLDEATKVIREIEAGRKAYEFTIALGATTTTGDAEGEILERAPVPALTTELAVAALARCAGEQAQVPPMYSAVKHAGRRLYELAREGVAVPRAGRTIVIESLQLIELTPQSLAARCVCSKGTYIRVLAEDVARALGTVGHVVRLRRTWVEPFVALPMVSLEALLGDAQAALAAALPADTALRHLPGAILAPGTESRYLNGQAVRAQAEGASEQQAPQAGVRARVYRPDGVFLGLGEWSTGGHVRARRLLHAP